MIDKHKPYDCIIIGAGPGGLQAAIHLARYNRAVLLLDRGGGRTRHAAHIENYLGQKAVSGKELIDIGLEQIKHFNVDYEKTTVLQITKEDTFKIHTKDQTYSSPFVIASTGATEKLPHLKNLHLFFGKSFFTCVDCDGYRTTGKKLLIIGNSFNSVRLSVAMKEMFTNDITLLLVNYNPPADYKELLEEEGIRLVYNEPVEILGKERMEGVKLKDDGIIECEVIMCSFGYILNDDYLSEFPLKRDRNGFKIITDHNYETSVPGLFALGALKTGNAQAIIAAGQGASVAININQRLLEI